MSEDKIHEKDWAPVTGPMFEDEADVIGDILIAAGIPAKSASLNQRSNSMFGSPVKTAQVLVPKHLVEKARTLLDAKEQEAESR